MKTDTDALVARLLDAHQRVALIDPPTAADPAFDLAGAYALADRLRRLRIERGARPAGYKIGFTNRRIWATYGVYAPMWSTVYEHTVERLDGDRGSVDPTRFSQPRLEPEIVFGLKAAPRAGMAPAELRECIEWVAHGFEIVQCHYADWRFSAPDTVVDDGLHGRLVIGPRVPAARFADLGAELCAIEVELLQGGELVERGDGRAALGGPLQALGEWVDAMSATTPQWPIRAGDVVTTGTLTDAQPMRAGQRWTTRLSDARLQGLTLECAPR